MTDLIVIGFDQPQKADETMARVQKLSGDGLLDVERVAVVVRSYDGKTDYQTATPLPDAGEGAVGGGLLLPRLHALGGTMLKINLPRDAEAKLQRALAESA